MIREAIDRIRELCISADNGWTVTANNEDGTWRAINRQTGELKEAFLPIDPEVFMLVNSITDMKTADDKYGNPRSELVVFVDRFAAVAFFDSKNRKSARLPLQMNEVMKALENLKCLTPATMCRRLRVDLFGAAKVPWDFTEQVGALKFETSSSTENSITKGDESISKKVRAQTTNSYGLSEDVTFTFNMYPSISDDVSTEVSIKCAVLTEPADGTVSVIPYPGEMDAAIQHAVRRVADAITDRFGDGVPVICGSVN